MNAGQLEAAIVMIGHFDASEREQSVMVAMYADIAAMRQPITAEALLADGVWTHESTGLYRNDMINIGDDVTSVRLFVDFCDDDPPGVYIGDLRLPNVRTMYDLRELVRLMGGKA